MKRIFILSVLIFLIKISVSQVIPPDLFQKTDKKPFFIAGTHFSYMVFKYRDSISLGWNYLKVLELEPHISYYPIKNLGFGAYFGFNRHYSNYIHYDNFFWYGCFARYYFPLKINYPYFDNLQFFAEFDYQRSNYLGTVKYQFPVVSTKTEYEMMNVIAGFQYDIWKGITFEFSYKFTSFFHNKWFLFGRVGFEYHFYTYKYDAVKEL